MLELGSEIWLAILRELPKNTLPEVSLVNRAFATLCRQILFVEYDFHPYYTEPYGDNDAPLLPEPQEIERFKERIGFWASEPIAPLVRRCRISPWSHQENRTFVASTEPYMLMSAFFAQLPKLAKLTHLTLFKIRLPSADMFALCELPSLCSLVVKRVEVLPGEEAQHDAKLHVKAFALEDAHEDRFGLRQWLPLLHPSSVQDLSLQCDVQNVLKLVPDFPSTKNLQFRMKLSDSTAIKDAITFLRHFPALVTVKLTQGSVAGTGRRLSSNYNKFILQTPTLESALVPFQLVPSLLQPTGPAALTDLSIGECGAKLFQAILKKGSVGERIRRLSVQFVETVGGKGEEDAFGNVKLKASSVSIAVLGASLAFFPNLTTLDIKINSTIEPCCETNDLPIKLFNKLATMADLPLRMQTFIVRWVFSYDDPSDCDTIHNASKSSLVFIRTQLVDRYPSLRYLMLDGDMFLYRWTRNIKTGLVLEKWCDDFDGIGGTEAVRREVVELHGLSARPLES
ncbi:hypothetical protein HMN09_00821800 [Mycena chlorophos]|uniref:F-box domain-containing protein n=1 Tax=Mycena chlorophos TaxID=658473 RepID=A0A8H6SVZ1_MYCCL|nr:hypothetical protein HMN09_00821800 [Mycena chlorophos]